MGDDDLSMKAYWQFQCAAHPGVCDDDLVDDLGSAKGKIGKFSGGISWADNSLTCDSEGNCMLKDELSSRKSRLLLARLLKASPELLAKLPTKLSLSVVEMMMTMTTSWTSSSSRRSRLLLARLPKGSLELPAKLPTKLSLSVEEMTMTNETAS